MYLDYQIKIDIVNILVTNITMNSFSGLKDIDRHILTFLPDADLIRCCSLNRHFYNNICDDKFFYRLLALKFNISEYRLQSNISQSTYKSYYLQMVYYISKLKDEYNYFYISGNPKIQYEIFQELKNVWNGSYFEISEKRQLLYSSCEKGQLSLVKESVMRGTDIHFGDEYALRLASEKGYLDIVKYLISLGADIHRYRDSIIKDASEYGQLEIVKYLVSLGVDIHAEDDYLLKIASSQGHLELVKYLVSLRANIYAENSFALKIATENNYLEIVNYLNTL